MQVWTRPSLLVGGQPVVDRSVADEEKMQREIALLRSIEKKNTRYYRDARVGGTAQCIAAFL